MILALLACASPPAAPAPLAARAAPLEITPLVADADGALIPAVAGVTPLRYEAQPTAPPAMSFGVEARGQSAPCGAGTYGALEVEVEVLIRSPDGGWLLVSYLSLDDAFYVTLNDQGRSPAAQSFMSFDDSCTLGDDPVTVTWLAMDLCTGATASAVVELPLWVDPWWTDYYCASEAP